MVEYRENPDIRVIEILVNGEVTEEDFEEITHRFDQRIDEWGTVKVLEEIRNFSGMEPGVFWKDLKYGLSHFRDIEKAAVVADKKWMKAFTKAVEPFVPGDIEFFELNDVEKARSWIQH